jgi:SAM-dependent methyltransferase
MSHLLNDLGDRLLPTTGRHGADIARQRLDALDRAALRHAIGLELPASALDLGGGYGLQALRLAALGLDTWLIDQLPRAQTVLGIDGLAGQLPLHHLPLDARTLTADQLPDAVALCCSQRFIHYLRRAEALALLRLVRSRMRPDGRLFLSASGLDSELGEGYAAARVPVADRFGPLAPAMADKHGIHEPVCLYAPQELESLAEAAGFVCEEVSTSVFGNVKGVFTCAPA